MEWLHYAVDYGMIGLLVVMSIIAFSIGIERYLVFKKVRIENYEDKKSLELYLTQKLHIIAIVGSNAPHLHEQHGNNETPFLTHDILLLLASIALYPVFFGVQRKSAVFSRDRLPCVFKSSPMPVIIAPQQKIIRRPDGALGTKTRSRIKRP